MMQDYPAILLGTLRLGHWERSLAQGDLLRIELGACYPAAMVGQADAGQEATRLLEALKSSTRGVLDRQGHRRLEYEGLLLYAIAQTIRLNPPVNEQGAQNTLIHWGRRLEPKPALNFSNALPAGEGASIAGHLWNALALHSIGMVCQHAAFCHVAAAVFGAVIQRQTPGGPFLKALASDNPETHWYHELVVLHAVNSYAVLANDAVAHDACWRAADFHLQETQPDHATNQPWGMPAFLSHPDPMVRQMGEGMLHAARALDGAVGSTRAAESAGAKPAWGLTSILLADALYCLTS